MPDFLNWVGVAVIVFGITLSMKFVDRVGGERKISPAPVSVFAAALTMSLTSVGVACVALFYGDVKAVVVWSLIAAGIAVWGSFMLDED